MTVIALRKPVAAKLQCSSCGAEADAACECGVAYVPAGERAARAIEANPDRSDRAIAADIGVSHMTVKRARGVTNVTPEKREGRDGKSYPVSKFERVRRAKDRKRGRNAFKAFMIRAAEAKDL